MKKHKLSETWNIEAENFYGDTADKIARHRMFQRLSDIMFKDESIEMYAEAKIHWESHKIKRTIEVNIISDYEVKKLLDLIEVYVPKNEISRDLAIEILNGG